MNDSRFVLAEFSLENSYMGADLEYSCHHYRHGATKTAIDSYIDAAAALAQFSLDNPYLGQIWSTRVIIAGIVSIVARIDSWHNSRFLTIPTWSIRVLPSVIITSRTMREGRVCGANQSCPCVFNLSTTPKQS